METPMADKLNLLADDLIVFHCPGCQCAHEIPVNIRKTPHWFWNKDLERPTVVPTLDIFPDDPDRRCKFGICEGNISFMSECWHKLRGQTVLLPDWKELVVG
jgi:hypothetical protein